MRELIVSMYTGYYGEEGFDILVVSDSCPHELIDRTCLRMAIDHAESFGPEVNYSEIGYFFNDYEPLIHDELRPDGGSWVDDFAPYRDDPTLIHLR